MISVFVCTYVCADVYIVSMMNHFKSSSTCIYMHNVSLFYELVMHIQMNLFSMSKGETIAAHVLLACFLT